MYKQHLCYAVFFAFISPITFTIHWANNNLQYISCLKVSRKSLHSNQSKPASEIYRYDCECIEYTKTKWNFLHKYYPLKSTRLKIHFYIIPIALPYFSSPSPSPTSISRFLQMSMSKGTSAIIRLFPPTPTTSLYDPGAFSPLIRISEQSGCFSLPKLDDTTTTPCVFDQCFVTVLAPIDLSI